MRTMRVPTDGMLVRPSIGPTTSNREQAQHSAISRKGRRHLTSLFLAGRHPGHSESRRRPDHPKPHPRHQSPWQSPRAFEEGPQVSVHLLFHTYLVLLLLFGVPV